MCGPQQLGGTLSLIPWSKIWLLRILADLIVGALYVGNLLRVQAAYIRKRHVQVKKEPAWEIKDWGKTLFVFPNIPYFFSTRTLSNVNYKKL